MRRNRGLIGAKSDVNTSDATGIFDTFDAYNAKSNGIWPLSKSVDSISGNNGTNLDENVATTFTVNTQGFSGGDTLYYSIATVSGTTLTGADFSSGS